MAAQGVSGGWEAVSESTTAPGDIAHRLTIEPGDPVMRTDYLFTGDGAPVMLSTSYEPLRITGGTDAVLPEHGPYAGRGVVERMRAIGHEVTSATEIVTARTAIADEADRLGIGRDTVVMVVQRTYTTATGPIETADIVVPVDRYELAYEFPVNQD
jgi:GntR family transcriptional regulator